ncbi:MAG: hypothetical protein PHX87_02355 [Candidatus Peribacteraceae bacterium]|nr:hypothetical protein [Candidatus Peribacteraceae bacterium]MDD5742249.1 hypothetical protein [Candidatus Peribacteraceae bacterium]
MFDCDKIGREWAEQQKRHPTELEMAGLLSHAPESNKGALSVAIRRIIKRCLSKQNRDDPAANHR